MNQQKGINEHKVINDGYELEDGEILLEEEKVDQAKIENETIDIEEPLTQQEIWDDSELIAAWDEAVEEYRDAHSGKQRNQRKRKRFAPNEEYAETEQESSQEIKNSETEPTMFTPQLPPGVDPELHQLLLSWYYAGYYTGVYQASRNK